MATSETREFLEADDSVGVSARAVDRRTVAIAVVASVGGLFVHNLADFPPAILLAPETLVPVAVTVLLGVAMLRRPGRSVFAATMGWALVVIVGGGGSVLPLSILPFVPVQTVGHYVAHGVYALVQTPLLWVAWKGFEGIDGRTEGRGRS